MSTHPVITVDALKAAVAPVGPTVNDVSTAVPTVALVSHGTKSAPANCP